MYGTFVVSKVKEGDGFTVAQIAAGDADKWLIHTATKNEADLLAIDLGKGTIPTPTADPSRYQKVGLFGNVSAYMLKK